MNTTIISIGDELLIGQVVNTNASWMGVELNKIGIDVQKVVTIADDAQIISNTVKHTKSDIILITGGLGPTKDDITKKTLAELWGCDLIVHQPTLDRVRSYFEERNFEFTPTNQEQALVPSACTPFLNEVGTAPTMYFTTPSGQIIVSMPGVPFEMKWMMEHHILPLLQKKTQKAIVHKTILTFGIGESFLSDRIEQWELQLPKNIALAYLPNHGQVRLRLSAHGSDKKVLEQQIDQEIQKVLPLIQENVYGYDDDKCIEFIGEILSKNKLTLATAESCTGGTLGHRITENAGASAYYNGGVISYTNALKTKLLGVKKETLDKYGAVSEQVACEMALGALDTMDADFAMSTTGISGPTGGSKEKPLGTVWIATASKKTGATAHKYIFKNTREAHQERAANQATFDLYLRICKELNCKK